MNVEERQRVAGATIFDDQATEDQVAAGMHILLY